MTLSDIASLISSVGVIITAAIALANFLRIRKLETQATAIKTQAEATHELVNSRSQELLASTRESSFKEGRTEGRLGKLEDKDGLPNGG